MKSVAQDKFEPSKVSFGAGAFSGTYEQLNETMPIEACQAALELGINCFDTSPYYGQSEKILGDALLKLRPIYPRSSYYLATKIGRYGYSVRDFDYNVVYAHDVEFVSFDQVKEALSALFELKSQGKIKYVGISGYPLSVLLKVVEYQFKIGQPLDIVLSYCHYTLQNTMLADYARLFRQAGVKYIMNASPLSMGLLRDEGPFDWHPANEQIRSCAQQAAKVAQQQGLSLANLASRFSFQSNLFDSTVIGLNSAPQVIEAMATYDELKRDNTQQENTAYQMIANIFQPCKDSEWESPTPKERQ
ncbi:NADP-dependent oxidoreductase domain-containing protein [Pilobolus umbonatus]|nr:NADP-dependent oxidoreductase domain-containing protein [Pilobolus umbonatus]